MTKYISNSLNREVVIVYRVGAGPLISVSIQPRAILNEIAFVDETHFNAFKAAGSFFFNNGTLIEGKRVTEQELVAKNADISDKLTSNKSAKADKVVDELAEAATNVAESFDVKIEKVQKDKKAKK